jgi:deltex-like protein
MQELQRQVSTTYQEPVDTKSLSADAQCCVCLYGFHDTDLAIRLTHCNGHYFHKDCNNSFAAIEYEKENPDEGKLETIGQYIEKNKICPICKYCYGLPVGGMPSGELQWTRNTRDLAGYPGCGHFYLTFNFPSGIQGPNSYQPGQRYPADSRVAYLPDNKDGREILAMFQQAWDQKMLFTIGYSLTRQVDNVVMYNGIHMRTEMTGTYGYPDPGYTTRVKEELAVKGITPKTSELYLSRLTNAGRLS